MSKKWPTLSIRERKFAKTKLGLLNAAIELLRTTSFDELRVRDLCARAEISEASFFNYFPSKHDLLVYYIQLWSLEMAWHGQRTRERKGALAAIEGIFAMTAKRVHENPTVMAEIIAFQARMTRRPPLSQLTLAERTLAFPDLEGIEDIRALELQSLFAPLIEHAAAHGELPRATDVSRALLGLATIFFGVPVALRLHDPALIGRCYATELTTLWAALRSPSKKESR